MDKFVKRISFIFILVIFLFTGCEEVKHITLKGRKTISSSEYEELLYEWKEQDLETVVKTTHSYVYDDVTAQLFEEKLIDCDNYKRNNSLSTCEVKKENKKVIYKEIDSRDYKKTKEELTKELQNKGYKIVD